MSNIGKERAKAWEVYTSPSPAQRGTRLNGEATSMNAISFGFVATAILISMFLIMAIFEHLFKPTSPSSSNNEDANMALQKLESPRPGQRSAAELSVVMPGHTHPTFIAQPAPFPFPSASQREPIYWPQHT